MEKWFSILLDSLKSRKKIHFVMLFLVSIVLIRRYSPIFYKLIHDAIYQTVVLAYSHMLTSVIIFLFIYLLYWLARFSDKKHSQRSIDRYERPVNWESSVVEPVKTQIKDYMSYLKGERDRVREIILCNVTQNTIDYMCGWVEIYRSNKRVRLFPFEVKRLRGNTKHVIYLDSLSVEEDTIDEFHTFLEEVRINNETKLNQFLYGKKFYLIPPNLNEITLSPMEKITGLNLKWLKRIWREEVKNRVKWYFRLCTEYRNYRAVTRNVIMNLGRILLINIPIVCVVIFAVYMLLRDFIVLLSGVLIIWFEFFSEVINRLI